MGFRAYIGLHRVLGFGGWGLIGFCVGSSRVPYGKSWNRVLGKMLYYKYVGAIWDYYCREGSKNPKPVALNPSTRKPKSVQPCSLDGS